MSKHLLIRWVEMVTVTLGLGWSSAAEPLPCFIYDITGAGGGGRQINFTIPKAFVKDDLRKILFFFFLSRIRLDLCRFSFLALIPGNDLCLQNGLEVSFSHLEILVC